MSDAREKGFFPMREARYAIRSSSLVLTVLLSILSAGSFSLAGASTTNDGIIAGRVSECGPGPIVASPDPTVPTPKPISVRVERDGQTIVVQSVKLPVTEPWTGTFRFSVPAGKYEVISSYRGVGRWVSVRPGVRSVVVFPLVACPQSAAG